MHRRVEGDSVMTQESGKHTRLPSCHNIDMAPYDGEAGFKCYTLLVRPLGLIESCMSTDGIVSR